MRLDELDTPVPVVDLDKVERNLRRMQDYCDAHGLKLRPHIKTHKLPQFAKAQVELGAVGITCQKIGEAEVMADAGIEDIFLPYNILGGTKLMRLRALALRTKLSVTADSRETVEGYATAFADAPTPLKVLVECDVGMGRCGVQTPADAVALAQVIAGSKGLEFGGLMTYPPVGGMETTQAWFAEAVELLTRAGLPPAVVSNGGSPDLYSAHQVTAATEHRPGTYIYADRYQVAKGAAALEECAVTVLATVISRPTEDRAVIDAGSKTLTSDMLGLNGFGLITEYPDAVITGLSEEHGNVDLSACSVKPKIGDRVRIIPNHVCPVSNLFDAVYFISGETVEDRVPVAARGKLT